jgi:hypothetical protein
MMTEHDRGFTQSRLDEFRTACASVTSERIYVVPGIEYSDVDNRVHVLVWGQVPFLGENLPTGQMLQGVTRHNGVAVLAHPARRNAWECVQPDWVEHLAGVELWNRKYDGWAPGAPGAQLLNETGLLPFVGLDFHTARQMFPLGMTMDLEGTIDEVAIVDCVRSGRCAPQAFGMPLDERRFQKRLPLLQVAERGRRRLAALKRYSKAGLAR